jgi:hypothetical protein
MSILDEIVFTSGPLPILSPLPNQHDQCLSVRFNGDDVTCALELPTPWVTCSLTPETAKQNWNAFCQQLKQCGVPIECSHDALSNLPSHSLPQRIFRIDIEQPLPPSGASGAILIELTCQSARRGDWGWPPEVVDLNLLNDWLLAVRSALGGSAPLGLGLPLNANDSTLQRVASLDVDWIAVHTDETESLDAIVFWLVLFRQILSDVGRPELPIMVRTRSPVSENQIKLLAMGASLVSIDNLFKPMGNTAVDQPGGHLRSLQINRPETTDRTIINTVQGLNKRLTSLLASTNSQSPSELRSTLRATTIRAAQIARIPLLGD